MNIEEIEKSIGYNFKDKELLKTALTHTSYANENNISSYEKLEFLGDSILEFISSKYLFNKYTNLTEGELTKVRAQVVCEDSLKEIAKKHKFYDHILVSKSERANGGNTKPAILADCVEAVIAAIYFDGGLEKSEEFIIFNLKEEMDYAEKHIGVKDYKTVLQEKLQKNGDVHIEYKVIKEYGPDHNKTFESEVICNGKILAQGTGKSKKIAEMQAAKQALEVIVKE